MIIGDASRHVVVSTSDRIFGYFFACVFAAYGTWPLSLGGDLRITALVIAAMFFFLAVAKPTALSPLNRVWTKAGLVLGSLVSPIALAVVFYGVIFPVGAVMRMLKRDSLRRKYDASARTYWIAREPPGPDPQTIKRQF